MNVEYINPFIEASQTVLTQMGLNACLGKVFLKKSPYKSDSIIVIVGLTGQIRGQVALVMKLSSALHIVSCMMGGMHINKLDELGKSAIAELANMIMGNTATLFYNKGIAIEITPPSMLVGENMEVTTGKMKTVCIPLQLGEEYSITIDVSMEEK